MPHRHPPAFIRTDHAYHAFDATRATHEERLRNAAEMQRRSAQGTLAGVEYEAAELAAEVVAAFLSPPSASAMHPQYRQRLLSEALFALQQALFSADALREELTKGDKANSAMLSMQAHAIHDAVDHLRDRLVTLRA